MCMLNVYSIRSCSQCFYYSVVERGGSMHDSVVMCCTLVPEIGTTTKEIEN